MLWRFIINRAFGAPKELQDCPARGGFTTPALAYQAKPLTAINLDADAVHGIYHALLSHRETTPDRKMLLEITNPDQYAGFAPELRTVSVTPQ